MPDDHATHRALTDATMRAIAGPPDIDYAALIVDLDDVGPGMALPSIPSAGINGDAPRGRAGEHHPPRSLHDRPRV